jgi:hypothetical protein
MVAFWTAIVVALAQAFKSEELLRGFRLCESDYYDLTRQLLDWPAKDEKAREAQAIWGETSDEPIVRYHHLRRILAARKEGSRRRGVRLGEALKAGPGSGVVVSRCYRCVRFFQST